MPRLFYIIQKEFIQIFRNKAILPMMTVVPIVQMIVLSFAASNEVRNVRIALIDQDHSVSSRQLIHKIQIADRFILVDILPSVALGDGMLQRDGADILLVIPPNFEATMYRQDRAKLQMLVNAINGQQATVGAGYLQEIIKAYTNGIKAELGIIRTKNSSESRIGWQVQSRYWYNPELNYKYFMVPGIMAQLTTILVMLLTAMNIVREREIGTIEQINVTPIRKWEFILGKMIPFLLVGFVLLTVGMAAGKLIFDIPIRGSLLVVFVYTLINLIAVLGLGLFISNWSDTQQQAMFTTFFFVIIFILMSGLFTPIESMPDWAQYLTVPNPIAHFVHVMRSVSLKGSTFAEVAWNFKVTLVLALVFNTLAIVSYRKVQ